MAKTLGINWVGGELYCAYMDGSKVLDHWVSPTPVNELSEFNMAIRDICHALKVRQGTQIAMCYESSKLSHPFIEVPIMKPDDLEKVLFRRAEQEKVLEGKASWTWTRTYPAKSGDGVLLHMLARSFRNAVIRICQDFHLTPICMVPLSEVMGKHIAELAEDDENFHLLVALFNNQTEIMVARGDGLLLFLRDISSGWQGDADRLQQEIERTGLYAKQQFGVEITTAWISGDNTEDLSKILNDKLTVEVQADPLADTATPWAQTVTTLSGKLTSNFIPWYVQQQPRRRFLLHTGLAVSALLFMLTLATVGTVEWLLHKEQDDSGRLHTETTQWQKKLTRLQNRAQNSREQRHRLQELKHLQQAQQPLLFLRQLVAVQPQGIMLREVEVHTHGSQWPFVLRGMAGNNPNQGLDLVDALEHALTQPPLATSISEHGENSWQQAVKQGDTRSFKQPLNFVIRGVVR